MADKDNPRAFKPVNVTDLSGVVARFKQTWEGLQNYFSPGRPVEAVQSEPEPRVRQMPVGVNLQYTPRGTESTSFEQLRYFAANYDVARIAIQVRKEQLAGIKWDIIAKDDKAGTSADEKSSVGKVYQDEIAAVKTFFRRPDRQHDWPTWLGMLIEDRLTIDAVTLYPQPNRGAGLYKVEVIDGATIKPLVDYRGAIPDPPAPGLQQILYGLPRGMYRNGGPLIDAKAGTSALLYLPQNVRSHTPYGYSEIEHILFIVNTALRKRLSDLAHFTDSNIPRALLGVPDAWTPDQLRSYQEYIDAYLAGDIARRSRFIFTPTGGRGGTLPIHEFAEFSGDPQFDLWLLKITCAALRVTPAEIGFTDDVNRATADSQESIQFRSSIQPLTLFVKSVIDRLIEDYLEMPFLEFQWQVEEQKDPLVEARVRQIDLQTGVRQLDEERVNLGLTPYGLPPFIMTPSGPLMIADIAKLGAASLQQAQAGVTATHAKAGKDLAANQDDGDDDGTDNMQDGDVSSGRTAGTSQSGGVAGNNEIQNAACCAWEWPRAVRLRKVDDRPLLKSNDGYNGVDIDWHQTFSDAPKSPALGEPYPGAVEALQAFLDAGFTVYMSCGGLSDPEFAADLASRMRAHLLAHGLDPDQGILLRGKPRTVAVVDDRAIKFDGDWNRIKLLILGRMVAENPGGTEDTDLIGGGIGETPTPEKGIFGDLEKNFGMGMFAFPAEARINMLAKDRVNYTEQATGRYCNDCVFFDAANRGCSVVYGDISPVATCDNWQGGGSPDDYRWDAKTESPQTGNTDPRAIQSVRKAAYQLARDDLRRWRTVVEKAVKANQSPERPFRSDNIPSGVREGIVRELGTLHAHGAPDRLFFVRQTFTKALDILTKAEDNPKADPPVRPGVEKSLPAHVVGTPAQQAPLRTVRPLSTDTVNSEEDRPLFAQSKPEDMIWPAVDEFSIALLDMPPAMADRIRVMSQVIPEDALASFGRETEPHVTLLYGLPDDDPEPVGKLLINEPPVRITLGAAFVFRNPTEDVVAVGVISPDAMRLNRKLSGLPHASTFPTYVPHVTVAYVKSGLGEKYVGALNDLEGREATISRVVFSDRHRNRHMILLNGVRVMGKLNESQSGHDTDLEFVSSQFKVESSDSFAKALGWSSWTAAWRKAAPPPPPQGAPSSPGPTGGHWVTLHGHHVYIDDQGNFHFGGPASPGHDPNALVFTQQVGSRIQKTVTSGGKGKFQVHGIVQAPTGTSGPHSHHVEATYAGFGGKHAWRLDLKDQAGNLVHSTRSSTSSRSAAEQTAMDVLEAHHAATLRQYSAHHVATVQSAQVAPATVTPSLQVFHNQQVNFASLGHGNLLAGAMTGATVSLTRAGFGGQHGYRLTLMDASGNTVSQHALRATGTDYAKMAASMLLHNHLYGSGLPIPAGGGKTAQDALSHAGVNGSVRQVLPSHPMAPNAPTTLPGLTASAVAPVPPPRARKPRQSAVQVAAPTPDQLQQSNLPAPKLTTAQPYTESQVGSGNKKSLNVPQQIDHTYVDAYGRYESSLGSDWSVERGSHLGGATGGSASIVKLTHKPTNTTVTASFPGMTQPGGSASDYQIDVEHNGQNVTRYLQNAMGTSGVPRDANYVLGRAVQMAHYLEDTHIKKVQQQQAGGQLSFDTPLKQFAWHYQKPAGGSPISLSGDSAAWKSDQARRGAAEAFLRKTWNMDSTNVHGLHGSFTPAQHSIRAAFDYLNTDGLNDRDTKILRLATFLHDVGKHAGHGGNAALDNNHPEHSVQDALPQLARFRDQGLSDQDLQDVAHLIRYHDIFFDSSAAGAAKHNSGKYRVDRAAGIINDERMADLFRRIWHADAGSLPGLHGDTDTHNISPSTLGGHQGKLEAEIQRQRAAGILPTRQPYAIPSAVQPSQEPDLRPAGVQHGEFVQRDTDLPVGEQIAFDPTGPSMDSAAHQHIYDEAKKNPGLNYARSLGMAYDGPTGHIVKVYHGTNRSAAQGITAQGVRAGKGGIGESVYGHGIYTVVNGARQVPGGYNGGAKIMAELHTGRVISHDDVTSKLVPAWRAAHPNEARLLQHDQQKAAAALAAGYSTISDNYSGHPMYVVLDPARMRTLSAVDGSSHSGLNVNVSGKGQVQHRSLAGHEVSTPSSHPDYVQLRSSGRPEGYTGPARTA